MLEFKYYFTLSLECCCSVRSHPVYSSRNDLTNIYFLRLAIFYDGIKIAVVREVHDGFYDGFAECRRKLTAVELKAELWLT